MSKDKPSLWKRGLVDKDAEYEMAIHIATAFSHVMEARRYNKDVINDGALNDARNALWRLWEGISEENRKLVDLSALYYAAELRRV